MELAHIFNLSVLQGTQNVKLFFFSFYAFNALEVQNALGG